MNAPFDAAKFKAATREQWDKHAKGWNDHSVQISDWLLESTDAMLAMAEVGPGARVSMLPQGLAIRRSISPSASDRPGPYSPPICRRQSWSTRRKKHGVPATAM